MIVTRHPWQDRFSEPGMAALRAGLGQDAQSVFDRIRAELLAVKGMTERVAWYGLCWCWCLEYRQRGDADPVGLIIPSPTDLQFAMPLEQAFVSSLPYRRLKRGIREGLDLGRAPFDTRWAVWSVGQAPSIDDLSDLLARRLSHRPEPAASARSPRAARAS